VSAGGRRFSVQVPDWGQDHLSAEAVAAYVDGELAERPYDRATRHLAACSECAAQVVAQGQASAALRSARCPSLSSSLMSNLRSIPQVAELPAAPNGLAMSQSGELVTTLGPERSRGVRPADAQPAGLAEPPVPGKSRRGARIGAGAAISGLALGALALGAAIFAGDAPAGDPGPPPSIDAHLHLP
jgi:anti-sigma factor RsiW